MKLKSQATIEHLPSLHIAASITISAVSLILYWKSLSYPFIEDDWLILHSIVTKGPGAFLGVYTSDSLGRHFMDPRRVILLSFDGDSIRSVRLTPEQR